LIINRKENHLSKPPQSGKSPSVWGGGVNKCDKKELRKTLPER